MPTPTPQCTMKARRRISKKSKEQRKPVNRFSNRLRNKPWKRYKRKRMKYSVKTSPKEKCFGSKSSAGLSLPKVTWLYLEETRIKMNSSSRDTWSQEICICIRTTEELPLQLSRVIAKKLLFQLTHWNKQLFLQSADLKLGRLRSFLAHGGSTQSKFQSRLQLVNFYPQVHSWFEAKEISFTPTEWKWVWHYCTKLTTNPHKGISMIEEFIRRKPKSKTYRIKKPNIISIFHLKKTYPINKFKSYYL